MNLTQRQNFIGASDRDAAGADDEIDLGQLVGTLWRGKFFIAFCGFVLLLLGGYYAYFKAIPAYTANSVVVLESRQEQVVDLESVMSGLGGDQATVNTEVEVIRSRGLIGKLVRNLDLLQDPEFNTTLRPEPRFSIGKGIAYLRDLAGRPAPEPLPLSDRAIRDLTIDNVQRAISASNVRQSYVFEISVITWEPEKSARLANTLAELYVQEQLEVKFAATERATAWLSDRVTQLQQELEAAEEALKAYSSNTDLVSPEALLALNRQLKDLRERRQSAASQIENLLAQIARLEAARATGDPKEMAEAADDRQLSALLNAAIGGSDLARQRFNARVTEVLARLTSNRDLMSAQIQALASSITTVESQIEVQSNELVKLQQLQREAEANRLIYEYFLGRLKETSVQQGIQQPDSRILSEAVVPRGPSAPRKSLILAVSLMLGTLLGAGLVLLREMSQNTFRLAEQLEKKTGYTVMGQIPTIPARRRKKVLDYLSERPNSAAAESIRNLRTSLLHSNLDKPPQIFMSTSSVPGEGKTTTSLALTQNLAGLGKKVLLIEGDIRRRTFGQYFNVKDRKGLLSVLAGEATLEEAALFAPEVQADVLIGEKSSINAADVFSSERFRSFLEELRAQYDYIVIDTPPVLVVPDARVIGQAVDAIIYSVKWDFTTHRQVVDGLKSFESVNLKVAGLVLGQVSPRGLKRYGYGDSYGSYGYNAYYDR